MSAIQLGEVRSRVNEEVAMQGQLSSSTALTTINTVKTHIASHAKALEAWAGQDLGNKALASMMQAQTSTLGQLVTTVYASHARNGGPASEVVGNTIQGRHIALTSAQHFEKSSPETTSLTQLRLEQQRKVLLLFVMF